MPVSDAFNFLPIDSRLSTSGLLGEEQLQSLRDEGYQIVIDLLPHDNEWAVPGEQAIMESQGVVYRYIPVDFDQPLQSDYVTFEAELAATGDKKTHVHCAANWRVSAFYAIYAFRKLGWSPDEAMAFIAKTWVLTEHPVWEQFVTMMLAGEEG